MVWIDRSKKEFICKQCNLFLSNNELIKGCCPECKNDEYLYLNDINK